jgi:amino acid transporter
VGVFAALAIWMILSNTSDLTLQTFDPTNAEAGTFNGIFKGMVFCILAFIGFESSAPLAEETRDPRRNIPKAVIGACLGVGLFYVLCSYAWVIGTGFPNFTADTLEQANPWQHLGDIYWSTGWVLIFLAIVNSALANSNAGVNASSRVMFAMGRNGILPRAFARTHPEHQTPHVAIVAQTVFGVVLALLLGWKWGALNGFGVISYAATSLVIVVYITVCLATIAYYWRKARDEWNWWLHGIFPALGALAFLPPLYYQYRPLAPEPLRFGNYAAIAAFAFAILVTAYVALRKRGLLDNADRLFLEEEYVGPAGPYDVPPPTAPVPGH